MSVLTSAAMTEHLQTVGRAANILRVLSEYGQSGAGVTEIAKKARLAKSTTHRLLASLCRENLAQIDAKVHRYALGHGLLQLAAGWLNGMEIRSVALPHLGRLRDKTRGTIVLSVRDRDYRIALERLDGSRDAHRVVDLVQPLPLHLGATGKAILAFLPESEAKRILRSARLTAHKVKPLLAELQKIRHMGTAESKGEGISGTVALSAPVFDHERVAGSVSILGLESGLRSKELTRIRRLLLAATSRISRELGRSD